MNNEIILYQPGNQSIHLEVRIVGETVWLTQNQIAKLFGTRRPAITKHIGNIYKTYELNENSTCSILEHMGKKGMQKYRTKYYNLDVILSVGYRVNSINATQFRIWANKVLKDYLLKKFPANHRIDRVEKDIQSLNQKVEAIDFKLNANLPPAEGIFYDGQIFDAYHFVSNIIKSAKKSIILIDNYVDESVLMILSKRSSKVKAAIYTKSISKRLELDLKKHHEQYPKIEIIEFNKSHDRFLIIDENTVYHIGASLKDLGQKWFAFSKINLNASDLITKLIKN